ncbi:BgTH12-05631 [Blumeria graminis f. sp. triticale]|uniref:Eukaryotic translation initiation factor 3 subunit M n=1 Tax=Blumeria graminis f. sp. triticale TaxID=1689686 RepID=A0A9W4GFS8_BLUGR|nr:BgTH12-05631 [Blumeria graminis f. sp. triticale]
MAPLNQQVFIEGKFHDLANELGDYLQIGEEIKTLLDSNLKDDALKKLVTASISLNSTPEKEFTAAYNLLVYLVLQSPNVNKFLPKICENLSKPIISSPTNGPGLALNVLTTLFNLLQPENEVRFNVFQAILRHVKANGFFELLRPQLEKLDIWIKEWKVNEEDQRKLYAQIADIAEDAGDEEQAYQYILKGLRTFNSRDSTEISSVESQNLSIRALKVAILSATQFDFHNLTSLPAIQALSESHPIHSELLTIFSEKELEDYNEFREEHKGWIELENLDHEKLQRKIRLLTMASLAARDSTREIKYSKIAKSLVIPPEDVEMWVIDVIRAGLIEGKLSQQKQVLLVHRTTYRVFGEKQWREIATKLDQWKESLKTVKEMISRERQLGTTMPVSVHS